METKRVVFVSLKPSSTASDDQHASRNARRKRALGIEERATWEEFVSAACARLQIAGARAVYHASTGERVHGIEDVQDIEDLIVEEDESARMMTSGATPGVSPLRTPNGRANGATARGTPGRDYDGDYDDDDGKRKKKKRRQMKTLKEKESFLLVRCFIVITTKATDLSLDITCLSGTGRLVCGN